MICSLALLPYTYSMRQTQISATLRELSCAHVMRHKAHTTLIAYQLFQRTFYLTFHICRCEFRTLQIWSAKRLISKCFCGKFLKNLAHEAKPAREKFRGRWSRQNGRVHVTWAWAPHSGRTHFAHPYPRAVGIHKTLTKTWPHDVYVRPYFARIWVPICAHKSRPCAHTKLVVHARPYLPTSAHEISDAQTCG